VLDLSHTDCLNALLTQIKTPA